MTFWGRGSSVREKYNTLVEYGVWTPGCCLHKVDVLHEPLYMLTGLYRVALAVSTVRLVLALGLLAVGKNLKKCEA